MCSASGWHGVVAKRHGGPRKKKKSKVCVDWSFNALHVSISVNQLLLMLSYRETQVRVVSSAVAGRL